MTERRNIDDLKLRFVQHEDMDEAALANLVSSTLEQIRAASTRMATWLVVGNGAALTLCYQTMLSMGATAPPLLSMIAAAFAAGLICAFLSFVNFQNSLIATYNILETMHLARVAKRLDLTPPSPNSDITWKQLQQYQGGSGGLLLASAILFTLAALSPVFGVLDPDFFEVLDSALRSTEGVPTVPPPSAN